ncbi:Chromate resistance protein ChrB [Pseudarthrobacter sp. J75]|uniref:Chromate resistance protein ChrB n=1 Tax=unclassified Pseudarthrobacter TaxID=2647000 RepID=UPI002E81417B|nr:MULTISPECIES: Chromate resistance protein ChrB [unclassified Pseudarthrobacter]MEE2522161.1 Chromate resistance protein ChrB [Pseudarthrobacter sp. J47]MEE2528193.1 Chromate resistance protein ChrB [Pseudarthrobacter sp. J75]MEE2567895.1 Chromate resistance protein ChrB [Pseudarthrobacter sp. J64]
MTLRPLVRRLLSILLLLSMAPENGKQDLSISNTWLLLIYRLPSEPSRLRATVWRRLKSAGAIYLANSVAALPESPWAERTMRKLRAEVEGLGGSGQLLRAETLVGAEQIVEAFNTSRDAEYAELLGQCADFHAELEKEVKAKKFTYAELEENEEDLAKLRAWLDKISARDTLGAPTGDKAREAVEACAEALDEFAEYVYAAELDTDTP